MLLFAARKLGCPVDLAGKLHDNEEGDDTEDRDRQACIAGPEESIGKENEIDELGDARFQKCESCAHHESHVGYDQEYRDNRCNNKSKMDVDMVGQIGEKQMKAEISGTYEEVIHGMDFDILQGGDDEHQEQKKE